MFTHLCFDLDGTLTDSREGILRSFGNGLRAVGLPVRRETGFYDFVIGPPLAHSYAALGANGSEVERAIAAYRAYYAKTGIFECRVYDGIREALSRLREAGVRLYLVTAKPEVYARRILAHLALDAFFADVIGPTLSESDVPKAALLEALLARQGLAATNGIGMVGDRRYDMEAARAVGVCPVGVLWGYGDAAELSSAGAEILWKSPEEIQP